MIREIDRLIIQGVISRVEIAVEKLSRRRRRPRRRKQRDASTKQSNNFIYNFISPSYMVA